MAIVQNIQQPMVPLPAEQVNYSPISKFLPDLTPNHFHSTHNHSLTTNFGTLSKGPLLGNGFSGGWASTSTSPQLFGTHQIGNIGNIGGISSTKYNTTLTSEVSPILQNNLLNYAPKPFLTKPIDNYK